MKICYKVKIENTKQLNAVISNESVKEIIISRDSFAEKELPKLVSEVKSKGKSPWILMERISRYEEKFVSTDNTRLLRKGELYESQNRRGEACEPSDLRLSTDKIYDIKELDGIIIQNLDSFAYMLRKINKAANDKLKVELNYTMNCYNDETKKVHEKLYNEKRINAEEVPLLFTAPVELNIYELSEVGYDTFIVYSYIDTMVTANCLRKNLSVSNTIRSCRGEVYEPASRRGEVHEPKNRRGEVYESASRRGEFYEPICKYRFNFENVHDFSSYIIDRKGKRLYYKTYCKYCYNKIFNTEPLYLIDKINELSNSMGEVYEPAYRIDFSFETENEVRSILNKKIPESFTRGHIKNSIK